MSVYKGFSNQKKKGIAQFGTVHPVNSNAYAESVIPKYLFDASSELSILSIVDVEGLNGQVEYWEIELSSAGMKEDDVLRMSVSSSLPNFEFDIMQLASPTKARVFPISNAKPLVGDTVFVMGWVTAKSDINGNIQVAIAPSPEYFLLDGVQTAVSKDTLVPANSVLLPTENLIAQASLSSIDTKLTSQATATKQDSQISALSSILAELQLKADLTETQPVSIASFPLATGAATEAKQDTGNASLSSIDGKLQAEGVVDPGNSSVTPLGIGGVFTGTAFEVTRYAAINVCVASDVASATDGVKLEVSEDGVNWDHSHATTYSSATGIGYIFNAEFKYARVVYTNGAVAQTYFRLQTIFKTQPVKQSLYTIDQAVTGSMFAELGKNVIIGKTAGGGGGFVDVKVTPSGALTVKADVTGTVSVSNFPATQPVSGSVSVSNFPATQAVTGTFFQATQPVSGSVSVSNFPTTQNTAEQTQSGTITQIQLTVGLTAVRATVSGSAPSATRKKLMLKPSKNNTGSIYFGSSAVTTTNSMEIIGPDRLEFNFDASDYYLISDSAGQIVEILEKY